MSKKTTRAQLRKDFFAGNISLEEFKNTLDSYMRFRGFYIAPGKRPKWSGPFRDTWKEADADNAPYFDLGYEVDVYQEQTATNVL